MSGSDLGWLFLHIAERADWVSSIPQKTEARREGGKTHMQQATIQIELKMKIWGFHRSEIKKKDESVRAFN